MVVKVNPAIYIAIFLPLLIIVMQQYGQKKIRLRQIVSRGRKDGRATMRELAKKFIGKECLIYTFNAQLTGVLTEVSDGAIMLDNGKECEAVNLDYIMRIREYPRGKNGKKRSVIVD